MIRTGKARHARHGGGSGGHGPLTLIPMIDMLMILVVYLLVHSADTEILPNSRNISLPLSPSMITSPLALDLNLISMTLFPPGVGRASARHGRAA